MAVPFVVARLAIARAWNATIAEHARRESVRIFSQLLNDIGPSASKIGSASLRVPSVSIAVTDGATPYLRNLQRAVASAQRNAVNDLAREIQKAIELEIGRVFDRPTPLVQRPLYLAQRATSDRPVAILRLKNVRNAEANLARVLAPHMAGGGRQLKPHERGLGASYWAPSRTAKLDQYGNLALNTIKHIMREVDVGHETTARSDKFAYLVVDGVEGIWDLPKLRRRRPGALVMVRVTQPLYRKVLDLEAIARRVATTRGPVILKREVERAIQRARS